MTKVLNLDELTTAETRELVIGGKTYAIKEMSVEDFIETTRVAEMLESEPSFAKQMEATVRLLKRSIPDLPEAMLKAMSVEQLKALTSFVRGEDPAKVVGAAAEGADEKK